MNPDVYRRAVMFIHKKKCFGVCRALELAAASNAERALFEKYFRPKSEYGYWLGHPDRDRDIRILALLLMAEIVS